MNDPEECYPREIQWAVKQPPTILFMNEKILERLEKIEKYSLLAAKKVLNLDDVAALTGLAKSYLYKLTSRKEIPHYCPNGKQIFFDREEIENWMKRGRVATRSEIEKKAVTYLTTGRM